MQDFLNEPSVVSPSKCFTVAAVGAALERLHQGASGRDCTSKKWIQPLRMTLIPIFAALFNYIYIHGLILSAWSLAVVVSLGKKGGSAAGNVMDGYRGVHVLNF